MKNGCLLVHQLCETRYWVCNENSVWRNKRINTSLHSLVTTEWNVFRSELTACILPCSYPCFENPYPMDIHESPVTACQYFANCPTDLIPAFYSVGAKQKRTDGFSEKVNGECSYSLPVTVPMCLVPQIFQPEQDRWPGSINPSSPPWAVPLISPPQSVPLVLPPEMLSLLKDSFGKGTHFQAPSLKKLEKGKIFTHACRFFLPVYSLEECFPDLNLVHSCVGLPHTIV